MRKDFFSFVKKHDDDIADNDSIIGELELLLLNLSIQSNTK